MSNERTGAYEAPQVEFLEVAVESGFAVSDVSVNSWDNGGHLGDYESE